MLFNPGVGMAISDDVKTQLDVATSTHAQMLSWGARRWKKPLGKSGVQRRE